MSINETTLADLVLNFGIGRAQQVPTLRTVLKTAVMPFFGAAGEPDVNLESIPAHRLYAVLTADRSSWCPALAARLPQSTTHQKAYCRAIKRLVRHGEVSGLLHPDQFLISPAWRDLGTEVQLMTMSEPANCRSARRGAFNRLARWATANGIEPKGLPVASGDRPLASFYQTLPVGRPGDYYRARGVWNTLVARDSTKGLPFWGPIQRGGRAAKPRHAWPAVLHLALEILFAREGVGGWRETTKSGYRRRISSYLGLLAELGVDVDPILAQIDNPTDALRLLFQGVPAGMLRLDPSTYAAELATNETYCTELLGAMAALSGSFDGRASEANPFLMAAVVKLVEATTITTAIDLVNKAIAINRGMLDLTDRHTGWLTKVRTTLKQLAARNPSTYADKKRAVFRHPTLWAELVAIRPLLREHTMKLEAAGRGCPSLRLQRQWAVALRNEAIFGLLLCYPLRAANLTGMRLDAHYRPERYEIFFPAAETKNDKVIDFELPLGGALGDVRELMDRYLNEARPILLAGRHSEHVFVPDPRGGTRLREKALNALLGELSRKFLADVLPPGVAALNPHLIRHAVASYALAVRQNLNLAAQLLNDSPSTITQAYSDVLAGKREATKAFLSNFTG